MGRTDPIADSLAIIRNAVLVKKEEVVIPYSGLILKICEIFKQQDYIENYRKIEEGKKNSIKVYLKYKRNKSVITAIKRVSKPSRRVYVSKDNVPKVLNGRGLALVSTPEGLLDDSTAREKQTGGEVLLYIW
jgi:small subunit ribosomal protein S8